MAADHLFADRPGDGVEVEVSGLLGHAGVVDHLEEQVPQLVFEFGHVAPADRVGDFIGLFDSVGSDGLETLGEIPGTASYRIAQGGHDR